MKLDSNMAQFPSSGNFYLPQLAVQVERDPHRATGPTEIWKIRIQALEDEKKKPSSKPIVAAVASNRRQRAIPEWRRRVSLV
uniref:Hepatoma-derived growth factor-related protein 2 n=1 Tax=Mesocestoides corti TaxID=53468 RepID=A0A5K3FKF2_MESCO